MIKREDMVRVPVRALSSNDDTEVMFDMVLEAQNTILARLDFIEGLITTTARPQQATDVAHTPIRRGRTKTNLRFWWRTANGLMLKSNVTRSIARMPVEEAVDITDIAAEGRQSLKQMRKRISTLSYNHRHRLGVDEHYRVDMREGRMVVTRAR